LNPDDALGVGIVYIPGIEPLLQHGTELVGVLEIEPQTIWFETLAIDEPYRPDSGALERLKMLPQAKIVHGVGFPVGGSRPPDPRHFSPLLTMIRELDAHWASEHLSFNRATGPDGEFKTGFLLPPRQTPQGVEAAAASICQVSARLPVPFAVETGVNYLRPRNDELPDGTFVANVATAADCGILLDLHNVWTNERNGRQSVDAFLAQLPLERVWEVHLAGGSEFRGYWLDSHSGEIPEALHALAARVIPRLSNLRALIFELAATDLTLLGLEGVRAQIETLRDLWELRGGGATAVAQERDRRVVVVSAPPAADSVTPGVWEDVLGALVAGKTTDGPLAGELTADPGVDLIRTLVCEFRAGMIVQALQLTSRLLMLSLGEARFRSLLNDFWRSSPPELFISTEGEAFATYLETCAVDVPYLPEVLAFERAVIHALIHGEGRVVPFPYDPIPLLRALAEGRLPGPVREGRYEIEVTAENGAGLTVEGVLFGSASG
jgi:uncharacterized protein